MGKEKTCDRCGKSLEGLSFCMSMFCTEEICMECKEKERRHPDYPRAVKREREEVLKGNLNFEGIGRPLDLG